MQITKIPVPAAQASAETTKIPTKWAIPSPNKFLDLYKKYGDIVYCKVPTFNMYLYSGSEDLPRILNADDRGADIVRQAPPKGSHRERISGNSILVNGGEEWRTQRRLLQPLFTPARVLDHLPVMETAVANTAAKWEKSQDALDIGQELTELSLQIATDSLFVGISAKEKSEVAKHVMQIMDAISFAPPLNPLTRYRFTQSLAWLKVFIARITDKLPEDSVVRQFAAAYDGDPENMALFMRQQVLSVFLASVETTSTTMTWLFYEMAKNEELWTAVAAEMSRFEFDDRFWVDSLRQVKMTSNLIHETLRLNCPIWLIPRTAVRDTMLGGYDIPAGANIVVSPYVLHRNKEWWGGDAEQFRVDRWDDNPLRNGIPFLPFGAGQHTCIGMHFATLEIVTTVMSLSQRFRLQIKKHPKVKAAVTYQPKDFWATPVAK